MRFGGFIWRKCSKAHSTAQIESDSYLGLRTTKAEASGFVGRKLIEGVAHQEEAAYASAPF
jgi:hypothetical protein